MEKHYTDLQDFKREFGSEKQCHDYLFNLRWPNGYRCPRCKHNKKWDLKKFKYKCCSCGYQSTATTGTIFQGAHIPLNLWFNAIWYVTSQTRETTALGLQKELGLGSNNTALDMLYNLRRAMIRFEQDKLQGEVAVQEMSYAGNDILVAVEINKTGNNRIRISIGSFFDFIKRNVEAGSTIVTFKNYNYDRDGMKYNKRITSKKVFCINKRYKAFLPQIYTTILEVKKQGLLGKLQYYNSKDRVIKMHYMFYYLVECCFKFNKRNSKETWFYEILKNALDTKRISYKKIKALRQLNK